MERCNYRPCGEPVALVVQRWGKITALRCERHARGLRGEALANRDGSYTVIRDDSLLGIRAGKARELASIDRVLADIEED